MVFGPNLLKKHKPSLAANGLGNSSLEDKYNLIDDIDSVISVTKYLIENQNLLFEIDSALHNELIKAINNVSPSETNSILTRKVKCLIGVTLIDGNRQLYQQQPQQQPRKLSNFIENTHARTSRTRLNKITNDFQPNLNQAKTSGFSNELYNNLESNNSNTNGLKHLTPSCSSSLLLMVQSSNQNKLNQNATKSMTNLLQSSSSSQDEMMKSFVSSELKMINQNSYICSSKFYDNKSKFNVIGEQETLV
jgi:hypothetical protein